MAVDLLPGNLLAGDEPFNDEQYIECLLDNDLSGEEMADTEQYAEDAPGGEQSSGNMPDDEQSVQNTFPQCELQREASTPFLTLVTAPLLGLLLRIATKDSKIEFDHAEVYLCLTVLSSSATTSNRSTQLDAQRLKDPKFMKYLASMYHDAIPLPEMALTDNLCNTLLQISKRVHEYCQELDSEQDQTVIEKEFYADLYANSYTEPWAIDRLLEWHHEYFRKRSFSPSTIEQSNLVGEIMREEVWDACNEAEENQAPGPDGLPVELYLYCDEAREILYQLANHILTDPLLLTLEFTAGYITVQYKGTGNARELANYQSISLQNSSATIIADIIARHI
ncbi:hypothetical protein LPJ79_004596 [Coemansia sp. RSA 1821]|nr:hypothetical protein LPJ79_004596 [Coemansia sp. RSA 1821]